MGLGSATAQTDSGRVAARVIPVVTIAAVVAIAAVALARGVGMNPDGALYQFGGRTPRQQAGLRRLHG